MLIMPLILLLKDGVIVTKGEPKSLNFKSLLSEANNTNSSSISSNNGLTFDEDF